MPTVMVARVTCPNCRSQFQTPIEQILDVGVDPSARLRLLNGLVNIAVCPTCRVGGALNLPLLYHDPEKELALVYMPMEAGRDDLERQQAIGKLTNTLMNNLPAEKRKGYLLQPQVFLTLDTLVNKVLEAEGITQEMIERQKAKAELLKRMIETSSEEELEAMIKANDEIIDSTFFAMLAMNLELAHEMGQSADKQRLMALQEKLVNLSSEGKKAKARGEMLDALRAEPSREKLIDLLIHAPDERTRNTLILAGRPLLDYAFFQALTSRIEAAPPSEKERLSALRKEILDIRDRIDHETEALIEARAALLRDLLLSDNPAELAERRFAELDGAFFSLLESNIKEAEAAGDKETVKALQAISDLITRLIEETLPPEARLFNRLMQVQDETEVDRLLQEESELKPRLLKLLEALGPQIRRSGSRQAVGRLELIESKVKALS